MKKIYLVTGGLGFIGSNFIRYLFEKYKDNVFVVNIDKLTYAGNVRNLEDINVYENYIFVKGDICDRKVIKKIFRNYDIDYVVNFAAESHVDRSISNSEIFIQTNILGTQVLIDEAKNMWLNGKQKTSEKKFVQISTDEVYGSLEGEDLFTENTPLSPRNPYAASKASADLLVKSFYDTYQFPMNITRCSNNYGEYQFPEKLIPLMISRAVNHSKLPIYGDGKQIRDWLYVGDHCKAIDLVVTNGVCGEVYNIGGRNEIKNIALVNKILSILREKMDDERINEALIESVADRLGHDRRYAINSNKIIDKLGWVPETSFEDGINHTVAWYVENKDWLNKIIMK